VAFLAASSPTPADEVLFSWQGQMDHMTGAFAVVGESLSDRALAVHFANGYRGGGWGVARVLIEVAGTDGEREWEEVGQIRELVPYHTLIHVNRRTGTYSLLITQRGRPRISVRDRRIPNLDGLDLARPVMFLVLDDSHEWATSYHVDDVLITRR
jgi:hypothetical protein